MDEVEHKHGVEINRKNCIACSKLRPATSTLQMSTEEKNIVYIDRINVFSLSTAVCDLDSFTHMGVKVIQPNSYMASALGGLGQKVGLHIDV